MAFQCAYHVVWCPKYRRSVIGGRMEVRLKEIIAEVIAEKGAWLSQIMMSMLSVFSSSETMVRLW